MLNFKFRFEHFVIIILVVILMFRNCTGNDQNSSSETTTVKVSEEVFTKKDSVFNDNIKNRKPEKVSIIETPEKVKIISDPEKVPASEKSLVKLANRYVDTTRITDGFIVSDILTEGRILKLDLKTSIDHLRQTIQTTTTKTKQAGGIFFSPNIDYIPVFGFTRAGIGFTYIKGGLGIGIGAFWGFRTNQIGFRFTLHKKIF